MLWEISYYLWVRQDIRCIYKFICQVYIVPFVLEPRITSMRLLSHFILPTVLKSRLGQEI